MGIIRQVLWVLLFLLSGAVVASLQPAGVEAEVSVADRSPAAFEKALPKALEQVLVKTCGNAAVMRLPLIQRELSHVNNFVESYTYRQGPEGKDQDILSLQVVFDQQAIRHLLNQAGQVVWDQDRPRTLVYWAVRDGDAAPSGEEGDVLSQALLQAAKLRGLNLLFPLMDLQDQNQLATVPAGASAVSNRVALQQMAKRYQTDSILAGQIFAVGEHWEASWTYVFQGAPVHWQDEADSKADLAKNAINRVATEMTNQLTTSNPEKPKNQFLQVKGIENLDQYARVQEYLQHLSPIVTVSLDAVTTDGISVQMTYTGDRQRLEEALQMGQMMSPVDGSEDSEQGAADAPLYYRWLGSLG